MQEDEELATKYGQDLSLIKSEIDRLTESVTQLLKFSKPTVSTSASADLAAVLDKILLIFGQRPLRQISRFGWLHC